MNADVASEGSLPEITIQVRQDRLEARAIISRADGGQGIRLARQHLVERLADADVLHGVETAAIDMLTEAWNAGTPLTEPVVVARGTPAAPAKAELSELLVEALTDPVIVERVRLRAPLHYQELADIVREAVPSRAEAGQVLARLEVKGEPRPGTAVDGEPLEPGPPGLALTLGRGVRFDPDELSLAATRDGIVLFDGSSVDVLPLAFDARVAVDVTPDGLSCSVTLTAAGPGGSPLTTELVASKLAAAGVKEGLVEGAIQTAVAEAGKLGRATAEVAQGREPQHGTDARLEYLVDLDLVKAPLVEQGGRVDFKSISVIRSVTAGQPLVRRHPPGKGVAGFTVTGRPLPARDGRDLRLPRGHNTVPDPDDPNLLVAKSSGNIRSVGMGQLEVSECFVVKGDVDYATGHVRYERSVIVRGDVKAGFNLDVGGDLEVAGLAEESAIKVGGNVLIRRGFVGQGQGALEAGGSVLLGFGRNQKVRCTGPLTVEREAINMTLSSRDAVVVNGLLVGGRTSAINRIVCRVLGNASGTRTELEVGVDHALLERRAQIVTGVERLRRLLAAGPAAKQPAEELWRLASEHAGMQVPDELRAMTAEEITALTSVLEEKSKLWQEQAYVATGACVVVHDKAWPGAQIQIAGSPVLKITDLLPGPLTFRLREGEVRWT